MKEFVVSVYLQGQAGLRYNEEYYAHPPLYTLPSFQNVTLTDYRTKPSIELEKLFGMVDSVGEIVEKFQSEFNQSAKLVICENDEGLTLALYDTNKTPTQRFLIQTDKITEIGIYDYHWYYFNWLNDEEATYMAIYDIPTN